MPAVRLSALLLLSVLASVLLAGCVVVKPYQREHLSERVMTPTAVLPAVSLAIAALVLTITAERALA